MKVFLDTNILLDAVVMRDNTLLTKNAAQILSLGESKIVDLYMSVLSIPIIAYVIKNISTEGKKSIIKGLTAIVNVLPSSWEHVNAVLEGSMPDIEDAMQVQSALEGSCDLIITRNPKDFLSSRIPVISPEGFLSRVLEK